MVGLVFDDAEVVIGTDSPAIRRRGARHPAEAVALRGAGVRRGDNGPRCPVPVLDERLVIEAITIGADGPAIRRRSARHPAEASGVGRGDDGPCCPVPMLDERAADGPAIRRRSARHIREEVVLRSARVGRADDGPRCPVPMLDQRLVNAAHAAGAIVANSPAIRRRSARHIKEEVVLRGAGVGRDDDGPRWPSRSERRARRRSRGIAPQWDSTAKSRSARRAGRGGFHPARRIRSEAKRCQQNAGRAKSKSD